MNKNTLEVKSLTFQYPRGKEIFHDFSYTFEADQFYGVVGLNGVGKSTLGKLLVKLLEPSQGTIQIQGQDIKEMSQGDIGKKIGYVYQNPARQLFATSVYEELAFPLLLQDIPPDVVEEKVLAQLKQFDLLHAKDLLPFHLSHGEKQRLVIAGILMEKPKFLILDEPTTSLDMKRKGELQNILMALKQDYHIGIVIISHDQKFLEELGCKMVLIESYEGNPKHENKTQIQHCKKKSVLEVDPRVKLMIVAVLSTLGVVYRSIPILGILFVSSFLIAMAFGVDFKYMLKKLQRFLKLLLVITVVQSIFTVAGEPIVSIGKLVLLTDYGVLKGVEFILRMGVILMLGCVLATSNQSALTQALIKLKIPYEIAFMSTVGIKFLPIFSEEFQDSLNAIMLRGIHIKTLGIKKKLNVYTYIFTPVVVNTLFRAKEMAMAMELRGFRVMSSRTSYLQLQLQVRDYMLILSCGIVLIVGIIGRVL